MIRNKKGMMAGVILMSFGMALALVIGFLYVLPAVLVFVTNNALQLNALATTVFVVGLFIGLFYYHREK